MDVETSFDVQVNEPEEVEDLFGGVASLGVIEHLTIRHVHGGERVGGAVALVVVSHGGPSSLLHRKRRLGPIQRLSLGFFVETEHHGALRWVHVETYHVGQLLFEVRVCRVTATLLSPP